MIREIYDKKIKVKHRQRYNHEEAELYKGHVEYAIFDDHEEYQYREKDGAKVRVCLFPDYMSITRNGEILSNLVFRKGKITKNILKSSYGDIEIELFTYAYQREHDKIIVEYDILSSSEGRDGYRIEFVMEEECSEFN